MGEIRDRIEALPDQSVHRMDKQLKLLHLWRAGKLIPVDEVQAQIAAAVEAERETELVCPVCGLGNGVWLRCYAPGCSDGRGLVPRRQR